MDFLKNAIRKTVTRAAPSSLVATNKADRKAYDIDIFVRTEADKTHLAQVLKPPMIEFRRNTVQYLAPGDSTDYAIFLANNRFRLTDALAIFEHKASDYCDHETFIWRGLIKNMLGRRDAIVDIERGLLLSPKNTLGRLAKICHWTRLNLLTDDCDKEVKQILKEEPENQFAAILSAILQSRWHGNPLDKVHFFEEVVKKFPANDYALAALAIIFCNAKCDIEARNFALRALKIRPGNLSASGVLRRLDVKDDRAQLCNPWDTRKGLGCTINELLVEPLWAAYKARI